MIDELIVLKIRLLTSELETLELRSQQIQAVGKTKFAERNAIVEQARIQAEAAPDALFDIATGEFQAAK